MNARRPRLTSQKKAQHHRRKIRQGGEAMKRIAALVVIAMLLSPGVALAGSSTDAALGLGAFAVFNQIISGTGIFGAFYPAPAVAAAPVVIERQVVVERPVYVQQRSEEHTSE